MQEEINKLTAESTEWESKYYDLQEEINKLTAESTEWESKYYDLQDKIDKIIKYIDNSSLTIKSHYFSDILNIIGDFYENNKK